MTRVKFQYQVSNAPLVVERGHKHQFDDWELSSESGVAFCDWKCKCGLIVSQQLAQREPPHKKLPKKVERYRIWREVLA